MTPGISKVSSSMIQESTASASYRFPSYSRKSPFLRMHHSHYISLKICRKITWMLILFEFHEEKHEYSPEHAKSRELPKVEFGSSVDDILDSGHGVLNTTNMIKDMYDCWFLKGWNQGLCSRRLNKIVPWTEIRLILRDSVYPIPSLGIVILNSILIFYLGCDKSHSIGVNFVINGLQFFNYLLPDNKVGKHWKDTWQVCSKE